MLVIAAAAPNTEAMRVRATVIVTAKLVMLQTDFVFRDSPPIGAPTRITWMDQSKRAQMWFDIFAKYDY